LLSNVVILLSSSSDILTVMVKDGTTINLDSRSQASNIVMAMKSSAFGTVIGLSALYVILLCTFLFFHALKFPFKHTSTSHEVEDAYDSTNQFPAIDGLLELGFPLKFKGKYWRLPYVVLAICFMICSAGVALYFEERENISETTKTALVAAMLLLFQISTDFSEYWVYTRNQDPPKSSPENTGEDDSEFMVNSGKMA
jgi:cytochrome bd-type quinol oxidase subunit 1